MEPSKIRHRVLEVLASYQGTNLSNFVPDEVVCGQLGVPIEELRKHIKILEHDGLVEVKGLAGLPVLTARLTAAGWKAFEHSESSSAQSVGGNSTSQEQTKAARASMEPGERDRRRIAVVHGRNEAARRAMFDFLRSLNLDPKEWSEVLAETEKGTPSIGEALDALFRRVTAVVVLITGDDLARLGKRFLQQDDLPEERDLTPQARPNVLFEAGLAFGRYPDQTVLVTLGRTRPFSDIAGLQLVRMDGSVERRRALASRLQTVGCDVDIVHRSDWQTSGNFDATNLGGPDLESEGSSLGGATTAELNSGPKIICLPPRICSLRQDYERHGETLFHAGDDGIRAAVVPYRLVPTPAQPRKEAVLTAQLTYLDSNNQVLHRVNYGFWVEEDFNRCLIGVRDTRELVLALWHTDGVVIAPQDNRHSSERAFEMSVKEINEDCNVDVKLVDEESGMSANYSFQLTVNPFSASQLISVPRR